MVKKREQKNQDAKKIEMLIDDLSALEGYISDLLTFSPLPICFISSVGVLLEFNPAFEKLSGYKFYEVIGRDVGILFQEKEIDKVMKETLKKGEARGKQFALITKKGKEVPVSVFTKARQDREGSIVGVFLGVFDMSEIRFTQQELEEKVEELEKFRRMAVGRELKMIELKKEIEESKNEFK